MIQISFEPLLQKWQSLYTTSSIIVLFSDRTNPAERPLMPGFPVTSGLYGASGNMTAILGLDWSIWVSIAVLFFGLIGYTLIIPYMTFRRVKPLFNIILPMIKDEVKKMIAEEFNEERMKETMKKQVPVIVGGLRDYAQSEEGKIFINNLIVEMIPAMLNAELEIVTKDNKKEKIGIINYIVSVGIENFKMQLNSFKSAFTRGILTGEDGKPAPELVALMETVPKQWRWMAQLLVAFGPRIMGAVNGHNHGSAPGGGSYRGG